MGDVSEQREPTETFTSHESFAEYQTILDIEPREPSAVNISTLFEASLTYPPVNFSIIFEADVNHNYPTNLSIITNEANSSVVANAWVDSAFYGL